MRKNWQLPLLFWCAVLFFSICFTSFAYSETTDVLKSLAPLQSKGVEANQILEKKYSLQKPLKIGAIADLKKRQVRIDQNSTATLGALIENVFQPQIEFANKMQVPGVAGGAILSKPIVQDQVVEFDDAFVVRRATTINVIDPEALKNVSTEYQKFMGERSAKRMQLGKLSKESLAGFDTYLKEVVPHLSADDPMRVAAAIGRQAVLDAVVEGKGELTVEDTILVPKMALPMSSQGLGMYPKFTEDGVLALNAPMQMQTYDITSGHGTPSLEKLAPAALSKEQLTMIEDNVALEKSGEHNFSEEFLSVFTKGHCWQWEQRWIYPSGFFRITTGAGYGFGLRVPFTVSGGISPTNIIVNGPTDRPVDVRGQMQVTVLDGDEDYYRRMLPPDKLFAGDEFVTEMQFGFGYTFRALWKDIAHKKYTSSEVKYSTSLRPPFGNCADNCDIRVPIPTQLTNTDFNDTALAGEAQIGLHLQGKGQIGLDFNRLINGQPTGQSSFVFKNSKVKNTAFRVDKIDGNRKSDKALVRYGFMLDNFDYRLGLTVTPEVRIGIVGGYKDFSRTFSVDWLPLNFYTMKFGAMKIAPHEGTTSNYIYADGMKSFSRVKDSVESK